MPQSESVSPNTVKPNSKITKITCNLFILYV